MIPHYGLTTQSMFFTDMNHVIPNVLKLFGYPKYGSVTGMLLDLGIPSFNTMIFNYNVSFQNRLKTCDNILVKHIALLNL